MSLLGTFVVLCSEFTNYPNLYLGALVFMTAARLQKYKLGEKVEILKLQGDLENFCGQYYHDPRHTFIPPSLSIASDFLLEFCGLLAPRDMRA